MSSALQRAREMSWYHTLELPGFETHGIFDLRPYVKEYGLPADMRGMRVLEVGTWDGFWAFEMERRGATVVALDLDDEAALDWPARRRPATFPDVQRGQGFAVAKELLGSRAERVVMSIYDATPEELGTFDLVFCGSVLIHLRDQVLALERIAALCTGTFVSAEEYEPRLNLLPWPVSRSYVRRDSAVVYWMPNVRCWKELIWAAGFDRVEERGRFRMEATAGYDVRHVVLHGHKS
jgi:tRNA (mo5U34)-methyltransferase